MRVVIWILLFFAFPASAVTRFGLRPVGWWWENIYTPATTLCGSYANDPSTGNIGSGCLHNYTDYQIGHARLIRFGGEYHTPVTETKDPLLYSLTGTSMVLNRDDVNPPSCSIPCYTYGDAIPAGAGITCTFPDSTDATARGLLTASKIQLNRERVHTADDLYRPGGSYPQYEVLSLRFDLLHWSVLQIAGFKNSWLALTDTPWATFNTFITNGGAAWSWSENASSSAFRDHDIGTRYSDIITARGGNPQDYVYYMTRPSSPTNDSYIFANGIMVRTDNEDYQDWYIDHVVIPMMRESRVEYYELAQKNLQHLTGVNRYCGNMYANYAAMLAGADGGQTGNTNFVGGWTCHAYVQGQRRLAQKLIERGIPYAIMTTGKEVYYTDGHQMDCSDTTGACADNDTTYGTNCEQDDWRWILAHASLIEFVSNYSNAGVAFLAWVAGKNIPYVEINDAATSEAIGPDGCPALP